MENSLADARNAGGDSEAGVALEQRNGVTCVADGDQQLFMRGKRMRPRILCKGKAGNLSSTPYGHRRVSVFADNSCVNGTRVDIKLLAKDMAKALGVEQRSGSYHLAGG